MSWMWWRRPASSVFGRMRLEDLCEFYTSLHCRVRLCLRQYETTEKTRVPIYRLNNVRCNTDLKDPISCCSSEFTNVAQRDPLLVWCCDRKALGAYGTRALSRGCIRPSAPTAFCCSVPQPALEFASFCLSPPEAKIRGLRHQDG